MPRRNHSDTRGAELAERLQYGLRMAESALRPGARELPMLHGVTPRCEFVIPQENVLANLGGILIESDRVFRYGNSIVIETHDGDHRGLATLVTDHHIESAAVAFLSNLVVCETRSESDETIQFPLPRRLAEMALHHEPTLTRLPTIEAYATRPLFDPDFRLRGPGWHPDVGYLVHGTDIEPILPTNRSNGADTRSNLPRRLRDLLADFCFRSDADLVNAIGALLTAMLVTRFIVSGKPIFPIDGNQPSLGKTYYARVLGVLFDDAEPAPIRYTADDDELEKKICAILRMRRPLVLLIDNAKVRGGVIESAVVEGNSTAPRISLRILGQSANHEQPNDVLWLLTMNSTRLCADLMERSCPIRLHFDGDPTTRQMTHHDLIAFVRQHRHELLGELAGMVLHWTQQGRPPGTRTHRLGEWARTIGGILEANNLPGFLTNFDEARTDFNTALDQLAALAEAAVARGGPAVHIVDPVIAEQPADTGLSASELVPLFQQANLLTEKLAETKSQKARSAKIAAFLSPHIDRPVPIEVNQRRGQATLRRLPGRSNTTRYRFDISWEPGESASATAPSPPAPFQLGASLIPDAIALPHPSCSTPAPTTEAGNNLSW